MNKYIIIGLAAFLALLYVRLRLFRKKPDEYDQMYDEILNSDKYKVKGQFD